MVPGYLLTSCGSGASRRATQRDVDAGTGQLWADVLGLAFQRRGAVDWRRSRVGRFRQHVNRGWHSNQRRTGPDGSSNGGDPGTIGGNSGGGSTSSGTGGSGNFSNDGICVIRHRSHVTQSEMSGYEEIALTTLDGTDLCVVRFQVERVGPGAMPEGCEVAAAYRCHWTHEIRYSNPVTMLDTDGVCANSQLALTPAKVTAIDDSKVSYGFSADPWAHAALALRYDDSRKWQIYASATWGETTGAFLFDQRDRCKY